MAIQEVFFVHLRRPRSPGKDPDEQRDDPFYEFGSFGCTGCHFDNLLNPQHVDEIKGARLAFIQGGPLGSRLVFLTPPIKSVTKWADCCEARWTPAEMPFKYAGAPVLARNHRHSDFPLVASLARRTRRKTIEGGLSSLFRSRATPLPPELANEVIAVYEHKRAAVPPSAIAETYEEALPKAPPKIDRNREATYNRRISELDGDMNGMQNGFCGEVPRATRRTKSRCCRPRRKQSKCRSKRCN
jgi:hypothetical protein